MTHILILPFLELVDGILGFYIFLVFVAVIVNLLAAFNVLNTYNRGVFVLINTLNRFTDPALYHVRRIIPPIGGIDFSPMIVIFVIQVIRKVIHAIEMSLV